MDIFCKIDVCSYGVKQQCCKVDHRLTIHDSESSVKFFNITKVNLQGLEIQEKDVRYLPLQYENYGINFIVLLVTYSNLQRITVDNLRILQNLQFLNLAGNELEALPKNLFQFNKKLTQIFLNDNKIKSVHYTVLNDLKSLHILEFLENKCYSMSTRSKNLEEVIENIQDFCWYRRDQSTLVDLQKNSDDKVTNLTQQVEYLSEKFQNYSYFILIVMASAVFINFVICCCCLYSMRSNAETKKESKGSNGLHLRRTSELSEVLSSNTSSALPNIYEGLDNPRIDNLHYAVSNVGICN